MGISIALAYILGLFDVFKMPGGGGISLESLPLLLFAYIHGPFYGFIAGFFYGFLMITKPSAFFHPFQFFLDYPMAFSSFFIAGYAGKTLSLLKNTIFASLAFLLRFAFHCISGVIFCSLFIPQLPENVFKYVFMYNITYLLPTALICTTLFLTIAPHLRLIFKKDCDN